MAKQHSQATNPVQVWEPNTRHTPVNHSRTTRRDMISVVTSSFGGKLVPLKIIPLLREDGLSGTATINVQMAETADMLLNPVRISAAAYFVPKLALDRFADMGTIDRSYNGQPEMDGTTVVPWFEEGVAQSIGVRSEFRKTLGLHEHQAAGGIPNTDYLETYNQVWNYIARNRSSSLTERLLSDETLAPAFWRHTQMKHVVPTFDEAMIDGKVQINLDGATGNVPVETAASGGPAGSGEEVSVLSGANGQYRKLRGSQTFVELSANVDGDGNNLFVDLAQAMQDGGYLSLAAIDQARETAAWARLRTQYQGKSEEWMMDQLLQGIRLNDDALKEPILLDSRDAIIGMSQRYATDAANLDKSATDGRTALSLNMRVPATPCGGCVIIVGQALPEQIYERTRDYFYTAGSVDDLPMRTADELDVQPVSMLKNSDVDQAHSQPDDLFGYAPLNHQWQRTGYNLGGKYYKDDPAAPWTEDRNRIWDSGAVDPKLGPDFYMSTQLQHEVFMSTNSDPFEWWVSGAAMINGLTYFGPQLREAVDDYEKVAAQVDNTRLKGDGTDVPA